MATVTSKRSVMTLYSHARCPYSHRVRMVIAEKGIAVEIIDVDPEQPDGDVMDLNPYGTLPILVDRDLTLYESRIIMEYLDERFPHPPLLPVDPVARANARLFLYRVDRDWFSLVEQIHSGNKNNVAKARKDLRDSLTMASPVFAAKPYFMSDDLTLVDCSIAPLLWRLPALGIELPPQARPVKEYAARVFGRPAFRDSLTELEREMRE